ncbi:MAG: hypothetical protein NVS2B15_08730 [Pseudarthrobacter sp.]
MDTGSQDGLFDEARVERVEPGDDGIVETGAGVNKRFRAFEPGAVMLVPPSLDEWLPQNHLSRFVADLVAEELDLSRFYDSYAMTKGQPPYDPRLMVRVLLHGYCVGVRSSRELERACVDVVVGQRVPEALELCRAAGMVSLGRIALDGTEVRANASRRKAMSYGRLTEKQKILAAEVSDMLADAQAVDADEDARFGADSATSSHRSWLTGKSGLAKMAAARQQLEDDAAGKRDCPFVVLVLALYRLSWKACRFPQSAGLLHA